MENRTGSDGTGRGLGQEARALVVLGLPLVGSSVAGFLIHMTDIVLLGRYDVVALAAATIASSFFFNIFILGAGFGNAVLPLVAEAVAAGDDTRARRVTRMALWLSLAFALLTLPLFWNGEAVLLAVGQQPEVARLAQDFLRIAMWGMFPWLAVNVLRAWLSAQLLTQVQLWVTLAAVPVNGVLNYGLIFGAFGLPELGIRGAAFGSLAVQVGTLAALAGYAAWRLPEARLWQRLWRVDGPAMRDVFRLGWPIGVTSLSESGLFTVSAIMMGWIGTLELAAHGVALQLAALTFMFHVGMSQAATVRAGGAYGRRDRAELTRVGRAAVVVALSFSLVVVMAFLGFNEELVGLFIRADDPRREGVVAVGALLLMFAALFQFADAGQIVALSLLRGVQDTQVPMWLAAFAYWGVGVPAGYALAFVAGLGPSGLWLGLTAGLATAAALLMLRFWGRAIHGVAMEGAGV
ncbi:MAG: MATE family efflux transporter [Rubellimicrobium sp.]|nr:MATE family efflux transporter [Rubellimicrobium sp.]